MRIICATFRCAGKYPLSKTALNNWVRYFNRRLDNSLRMLPVMRSWPDDFLRFRLLMTSLTSSLSRRLIGGSSCWATNALWFPVTKCHYKFSPNSMKKAGTCARNIMVLTHSFRFRNYFRKPWYWRKNHVECTCAFESSVQLSRIPFHLPEMFRELQSRCGM
jgi:hypothetical protein